MKPVAPNTILVSTSWEKCGSRTSIPEKILPIDFTVYESSNRLATILTDVINSFTADELIEGVVIYISYTKPTLPLNESVSCRYYSSRVPWTPEGSISFQLFALVETGVCNIEHIQPTRFASRGNNVTQIR